MKAKFFLLIPVFFLFSCKKESEILENQWVKVSQTIKYQENNDFFEFNSGKFNYKIPKTKLPYKKVMLLNASLVGYFTELGVEDKITGISSPEYVFSEKIHQNILKNKIQNIGNEQKYDVEKILAYKPDAIFTNYIQSFDNTYDVLKKNGIEIIFIDEYLVQKPLEKTKIIELFGKLLGAEEQAKSKYSEIEKNYNELKNIASKTKEKPEVLVNEIYGSQWFLPGGKTFVAEYIHDANAQYILKNNTEEKAVPMSFEEVFAKSETVKYWINVGNHKAKNELLAINPNYSKMKVFNNGKLYTINGKEKNKANDFFEKGVVRADLVLKDYIKIFHPELFPDYQLTYMKELK